MPLTCPHCGAIAMDSAKTCPACHQSLKEKKANTTTKTVSRAQRLAGFVLALNGIFLLVEHFYLSSKDPLNSPRGAIVSIMLGIALLAGYAKILIWVKISVIIGAVAFMAIQIASGDIIMAIIQLAFSLALILLLFGNPDKIRIGLSTAIIIAYFALSLIGVEFETTGNNFLFSYITKASYNLEPLPSNTITGPKVPYSLTINRDQWMRMKQEDAIKDVPDADIWLVHPDHDAHVIVIAQATDETREFILNKLVDEILKNLQTDESQFDIKKRESLPSHPNTGKLVEATSTINGDDFTFQYGIFAQGRYSVQITCYAYTVSFHHIQGDCARIFKSVALGQPLPAGP